MPSRVYPFVQVEMPFELGVPDGRWMIRDPRSTDVEFVLVLRTIQAEWADKRGGAERREASIASVTIVSAKPLQDEPEARDWLGRLDPDEEAENAFVTLNRLLSAHRIAAANPYVNEVAPSQALAIRAGFGIGEQVAQGRWLQARELRPSRPRRWQRGRRATILRSQERLARLLSSAQGALLCEELALRARLDLDNGRLAHAAGELERGLSAALAELWGEPGQGTDGRTAELRDLLPGVQEVALRLLPGPHSGAPQPQPAIAQEEVEQVLSHALGRLEAALRARAVALAWR